MKLAIMQPYFLPYIGYWQLINAVDSFVIHDDVQWIKGGWINRNRILSNKQASIVTLSIKKRSSLDAINKFEIVSDISNKTKFLNKIRVSYIKAPFFKETYDLLEQIILNPENNLSKYIKSSIENISNYLDINKPIIFSSDLKKNNMLKSQERVIDICNMMDASHYINPIGGIELYDKKIFDKNNIKLNFIKTRPLKYKQYNNEFVTNLSIVDIMMFNSKDGIKEMLELYDLI